MAKMSRRCAGCNANAGNRVRAGKMRGIDISIPGEYLQNGSKMDAFPGTVNMATLTIKNMPDELYQLLKATARRRRRSINSEALLLLEQALHNPREDEDALLERVRQLRARFGGWLTEDERKSAIAEGRR